MSPAKPVREDDPSKPFPFPTAESHGEIVPLTIPTPEDPTEAAIDNGIEETFPASDPVSVSVTKAVPKNDGEST